MTTPVFKWLRSAPVATAHAYVVLGRVGVASRALCGQPKPDPAHELGPRVGVCARCEDTATRMARRREAA